MAIRTIRPWPLRSSGLNQDEYSTAVENSLTDVVGAFEDFNAAASAYQLSVTGTSTTSVLIGTGSKSLTTQTGLGFVVGMTLRIANSSANFMTGDVTSYNSGTGALVVNVTAVAGSGTLASWTISLAAVGANSAGTISFTPTGNISSTNVQSAIAELDTEKLSSAAGAVTSTNLNSIITAGGVGNQANIPLINYDAKGRITSTSTAPKITRSAATLTTSGTVWTSPAVPSWCTRISCIMSLFSTGGTSIPLFQLVDAGGAETTGYQGALMALAGAGTSSVALSAGFTIEQSWAATYSKTGIITFELIDAATNTWFADGSFSNTETARHSRVTGQKSLSETITNVRFTMTNGTDAGDGGSIYWIFE